MITVHRMGTTWPDRPELDQPGQEGLRWHPEYPLTNTMIGFRLLVESAPPDAETTPWWMYHLVRDHEVVGNIGFHGPPDDRGEVVIGYDVVESLWGKGIASTGVELISKLARRHGARAIRAETEAGNLASGRVLIKNDFRLVHQPDKLDRREAAPSSVSLVRSRTVGDPAARAELAPDEPMIFVRQL